MLERVCRNGNPLSLLVRMQIDTTTMENSVEMSLKLEIKLPYDPTIPLLYIYPKETIIKKDTCTPMFIEALFTIRSHHFMGNRWGNSGNSVRLYFSGLKNHYRW